MSFVSGMGWVATLRSPATDNLGDTLEGGYGPCLTAPSAPLSWTRLQAAALDGDGSDLARRQPRPSAVAM